MNYFLADTPVNRRSWLDFENLPAEDIRFIDKCVGTSPSYAKIDAAWQLLNRGFINKDVTKVLNLEKLEPLCLEDEYRFVRRFYSPIWLFYCYFLRLIILKNPIKESLAFIRAMKKNRIDLFARYKEYPAFDTFESPLIDSNPLVSIIIPTLNRYEYLYDVLRDLEKQDYTKFEVIVVDQSEPVDEVFYDKFNLNLTLIKQQEKALWLARNTAIRRSRGDYLLLYDDDSRVESDWIRQHLKCLDYFEADISSGVSFSVVGASVPRDYAFFRWSGQLDTGNVMLRKAVFAKIGLFDRQFEKQRMGDGEFGLRCHMSGLRNISNPKAKRVHLKVGTGGLRQLGSWDAFRPRSLFAPRPIPSVLYFCRRYFGGKAALYMLLKSVPPSVIPYRLKGNKTLLVLGSLISVLFFPLILIQVWISWKSSSRMLSEGPKIETLDQST